MDGRDHEQGHRRRARETVDHADHEGARGLVETEPAEASVETAERCLVLPVPVVIGPVAAGMSMDVVTVGVRAGLLSPDSGNAEGAQHDEHESHRELHGEPHLRRTTRPKNAMTPPPSRIVKVCPRPHRTPISAAPPIVRSRLTIVATATT